jgi:hypothetical protein
MKKMLLFDLNLIPEPLNGRQYSSVTQFGFSEMYNKAHDVAIT